MHAVDRDFSAQAEPEIERVAQEWGVLVGAAGYQDAGTFHIGYFFELQVLSWQQVNKYPKTFP